MKIASVLVSIFVYMGAQAAALRPAATEGLIAARAALGADARAAAMRVTPVRGSVQPSVRPPVTVPQAGRAAGSKLFRGATQPVAARTVAPLAAAGQQRDISLFGYESQGSFNKRIKDADITTLSAKDKEKVVQNIADDIKRIRSSTQELVSALSAARGVSAFERKQQMEKAINALVDIENLPLAHLQMSDGAVPGVPILLAELVRAIGSVARVYEGYNPDKMVIGWSPDLLRTSVTSLISQYLNRVFTKGLDTQLMADILVIAADKNSSDQMFADELMQAFWQMVYNKFRPVTPENFDSMASIDEHNKKVDAAERKAAREIIGVYHRAIKKLRQEQVAAVDDAIVDRMEESAKIALGLSAHSVSYHKSRADARNNWRNTKLLIDILPDFKTDAQLDEYLRNIQQNRSDESARQYGFKNHAEYLKWHELYETERWTVYGNMPNHWKPTFEEWIDLKRGGNKYKGSGGHEQNFGGGQGGQRQYSHSQGGGQSQQSSSGVVSADKLIGKTVSEIYDMITEQGKLVKGINFSGDKKQAMKTYRALLKVAHPDLNPNDSIKAGLVMRELNIAKDNAGL